MKLIGEFSGVELAESWLAWSSRMQIVTEVFSDDLLLVLNDPDHIPSRITMKIEPSEMPSAFHLLMKEGRDFWPSVDDEEELAWRMLSVDVYECLESLDDGVGEVKIFVGKKIVSVVGVA